MATRAFCECLWLPTWIYKTYEAATSRRMLFTDTFALSNLAYMASVLTLIVMLSLAMLSRAYRPVCVLWVRLLLAAAAIWLFLWPLLGFLLYMVRPD